SSQVRSGCESVILSVSRASIWQASRWLASSSSRDASSVIGVSSGRAQAAFAGHGERSVFDHVFLSADHAAAAQFDEQLARGHAVLGARALGEQQERAVYARIAQGERV